MNKTQIDNLDINDYELIDVVSIEDFGVDNTYDIEVDQVHAFNARNDVSNTTSISHNSATLSLFSVDDIEMINAKTGDWFIKNPQRGRSNNSAALLRSTTTREQFAKLMASTKEYGEPGFIWIDDLDIGFNPCVTADTVIQTTDGNYPITNIINRLNAGEQIKVINVNTSTNEIENDNVVDAKLTQKNVQILSLTFEENGATHTLKCTPNHEIYTTNRGYVAAKDLSADDNIVINVGEGAVAQK
jgi:intein/homing endonuclease